VRDKNHSYRDHLRAGYVMRSLDLVSFKIDFVSSLVSWSIVASMAKYMIPPRTVRPTVSDSLVGCGITKSGAAIAADATIYLVTFFQGKLKVKHLRAIMYLHRSMATPTIRLIRARYVAASNWVFAM
jgi:hypothetical protein